MPGPRRPASHRPFARAGSRFPGDPAGLAATVVAVFPPGFDPDQVPPSEEELAGDPGGELPTAGEIEAMVARLPAGVWDHAEGEPDAEPVGAAWLGLLPRDTAGGGCGFGAGGPAGQLRPGLVLAALAADTGGAGLGKLDDGELTGLALAWRRLGAWAAAGELAAVAELDRRRTRQAGLMGDHALADHLGDELAIAMTLTGRR